MGMLNDLSRPTHQSGTAGILHWISMWMMSLSMWLPWAQPLNINSDFTGHGDWVLFHEERRGRKPLAMKT